MTKRASSKQEKRFKGVFCALFTPYSRKGEVELSVLGELVDHMRGAGIHGFYLCGTTGEGLLLTVEERQRIIEAVLARVPKSYPVIAHVGTLTTRDSVELAKHAACVGAHAVSALPPLGLLFKPRDVALHYTAIAEAAQLPFYAYHIPLIGGHAASSKEIYALLKDIPYLVGIKVFNQDIVFLSDLKDLSDGKWNVMNGYDDLLLEGLMAGADGAIGSTYNCFPELNTRVWNAYQDGDFASALKTQKRLRSFWSVANAVVSTRAGRYMLELRGFRMGRPRLPLQPLDASGKTFIRRTLKKMGFNPKKMV